LSADHPRAHLRRFVGISLGGGRGKTTAVARIELGEAGASLVLAEARVRREHKGGGAPRDAGQETGPFRDQVLLAYLDEWVDEHTAVGVDAPLTLPPCVPCQRACPGIEACTVPAVVWMREHAPRLQIRSGRSDPQKPLVTPYTQRPTELLLEHATLQPRETLGQGMGPLAARATYLRRATSPRLRLNENLLEVHPRATLIRLFGDEAERGTRRGETVGTWGQRRHMLVALSDGLEFDRVWPELVVRNVHVFHAVVCAFTVYLWAKEGWAGPEDFERAADDAALVDALAQLRERWLLDGWIWVPPRARAGA
jgi:predicted nuclease with RNAse H fold